MGYEWWQWLILIVTGLLAGFINVLAGGGSMMTLPALMLMGMPADIANATNRIGVLGQSLAGSYGFIKNRELRFEFLLPTLLPTLLGSLLGALLASHLPVSLLKPLLLGAMLLMAVTMLIQPNLISAEDKTKNKSKKGRCFAYVALFIAGIYGGFVQAGVGFLLIGALACFGLNLIQANAIKLACTFCFTLVALGVFIINDQVLWLPGLVLAVSASFGAYLSVKIAIKMPIKPLKWILFIMLCLMSLGALLFR